MQIKTYKQNYRKPAQGNKEQRTQTASEWLDTLNKRWKKEVDNAIQNTTAVRCDVAQANRILNIGECRYPDTSIKVFKNDVVTCAKAAVTHASRDEKICVLNYASYVNPGGGFIKGSTAQEEAICFATGLYPCLKSQQEFYDEHREQDTDSCYSDDYIYSKDVPFIVNRKCYLVDVLTMAAPNQKKAKLSPVEDIFEQRMELAYLIPSHYNCDVLLLGAWGCGVFGNDPEFVAKSWKKFSKDYDGLYREVVHPVLDTDMCKVFRKVMEG